MGGALPTQARIIIIGVSDWQSPSRKRAAGV